MSDIEYAVADRIATITLNRPEVRNAFTLAMVDDWADRLIEAQEDPEVRVVVVTGTGDQAFCAGVDRSWVESAGTPLAHKQDLTDHVHRVARALQRVDKPVIAAINGDAYGAGLDMALMCDLRVAARSARLAESYVTIGLVPGDGGCWLLPRLVGLPRALELLLTGEVVTAERAERIGMVNSVHDDALPAAYALATRIAAQPPVTVAMIKRATYQGMQTDLRSHLDLVWSHMAVARSTADAAEAFRAFREKRPGVYEGR